MISKFRIKKTYETKNLNLVLILVVLLSTLALFTIIYFKYFSNRLSCNCICDTYSKPLLQQDSSFNKIVYTNKESCESVNNQPCKIRKTHNTQIIKLYSSHLTGYYKQCEISD